MLEECRCTKLAKRNAESTADLLRELPCTAIQTALLLCYHNKLIDLETLNNINKTFQTKAMENIFLN